MALEYAFPGAIQKASGIATRPSSAAITNTCKLPYLEQKSTFHGTAELSSSFPSALTTVDGVPVSAEVLVRYRAAVPGSYGDGLLVAKTVSSPAGEWSIQNLNGALRYDVSARYAGENDALQANVKPFDEPRFSPIQIPVGAPVDEPLPIVGGTGSVSAAYVSGSFPSGVSLVGDRLQGTWPTGATGSYTAIFDLTDDEGTYTKVLTIDLYLLPMKLAGSIPALLVGEPVSATFTASGGEGPYTYSVSAGSLPTGLSLNSSTGALTGTPATPGAYSFEITATDVRSAPASKTYSGEVYTHRPHKYWRVYVTAAAGGYGSMVELEFLDGLGVRCDLTSGAPIQSSNYSGFEAYRAFDGVVSGDSYWAANSSTPPMWLGYQHAAAVAVNSARITARSAAPVQSPNDFIVQSSDDGVTWTDEWSVTGSTGWGANEQRTFTRP